VQRAWTANQDFTEVAHVKKTGARPNRHMFLNDPFILNRHLPAGELHHLRACSSMRTVERGPFHCLRHAVLKSPTYIDYLSRWRESLAALSVLYSSMQIVIGPTPPGTGVIQAARSFAVSNSTSPDSFPLLSRFTPTSITTAPGLTHSPRTKPALPIATTRISARAASSLKLAVREWQIVTVACLSRSISATGLPTILLRPTTTAFFPLGSQPTDSKSFMIPIGVQGLKPSPPRSNIPWLTGWKPSTSLSGDTASRIFADLI